MRLDEIREIARANITGRINRLSKKNSHPNRRNFSRYLKTQNKKDNLSQEKKPLDLLKNKGGRKKVYQPQTLKEKEKKKFTNNGKGQFIDVRI